MYTSIKSTKLTLIVTYIFYILLVWMMFACYPIAQWVIGPGQRASTLAAVIAFYSCCPAAWVALLGITKILKNVLKDEVFTHETVKTLRVLSWCCAFVALVSFITFFFYKLFIVFSLGAALMMLILRVLKNVMARAVEIKEENELTI
ncbi:MAG: DUF2975 domain-containing protein [Clostridia bacterium]|nr:DUF2975 domain-containing protein [Clostridia bacterium]